jgi:hypothetical protein
MDALAGGTCFVTLLVRHMQSWGSRAVPCARLQYTRARAPAPVWSFHYITSWSIGTVMRPEHCAACPHMSCTTASRAGAKNESMDEMSVPVWVGTS